MTQHSNPPLEPWNIMHGVVDDMTPQEALRLSYVRVLNDMRALRDSLTRSIATIEQVVADLPA